MYLLSTHSEPNTMVGTEMSIMSFKSTYIKKAFWTLIKNHSVIVRHFVIFDFLYKLSLDIEQDKIFKNSVNVLLIYQDINEFLLNSDNLQDSVN